MAVAAVGVHMIAADVKMNGSEMAGVVHCSEHTSRGRNYSSETHGPADFSRRKV